MVSKPAVIGYKGNMFSHQENTLEGIKAAADGKFQGVHMQVQATSDDKLIVFGDENLKVPLYFIIILPLFILVCEIFHCILLLLWSMV